MKTKRNFPLPPGAKSLGINLPAALKPETAKPKKRRGVASMRSRQPMPVGSFVLALDVSSTAAGLAVIHVSESGPEIVKLAIVRPPGNWVAPRRIDRIADEIERIAGEIGPVSAVVMEFTDGAKWKSKARGKSWSHSVIPLAAAQAAVRQVLRSVSDDIETVSSTIWTRGKSKEYRAKLISTVFESYRDVQGEDKGLDIADAIGIGLWRIGA